MAKMSKRKSPDIESRSNQVNAFTDEVFQCCNGSSCPSLTRIGSGSWTVTSYPPEISKFAIEPMVHENVKAKDIAKHQNDENLDTFHRALLCLKCDDENQKIFAANVLPEIMRKDENKTMSQIFPPLKAECKKSNNLYFHDAVQRSLPSLYRDLSRKKSKNTDQILNLVISYLDNANFNISDMYSECFQSIITMMNSTDIQNQVIPIIAKLSKPDTSENGRKAAVKLIETTMANVAQELFEHKLLPIIKVLLSDTDPSVRSDMFSFFPEIMQKLSRKDEILSILRQVSKETEGSVKTSIIAAISNTVTDKEQMKRIDPKAFFEAIIPMIKSMVKDAYVSNNINLLVKYAGYMGSISKIFADAEVLSPSDKLWFLDSYLQLSRIGLDNTEASNRGGELPTGFLNFRANLVSSKRNSIIETLLGSEGYKRKSSRVEKPSASATAIRQTNPKRVSGQQAQGPGGGRSSFGPLGVPLPGAMFPNPNMEPFMMDVAPWNCRANAAEQFPDFLDFALPLVQFRNGLHPMIVDLMHDPEPLVRAAMGSALGPLMEKLGTQAGLLHGEVIYALSDDNIKVIEAVVPHLNNILKIMVDCDLISPERMTTTLVELGGAILFCEERLSQTNNWRVHTKLLEQLTTLPLCIPGDYIYNHVAPVLIHRLLHMRQLPCRMAAADAIVYFLRHCRRANQREDLRTKIREDDHVANVRLNVVKMMPEMKKTLRLATDDNLLNKLNDVVVRIRNSENDRDVAEAIEAAVEEMAKISVVFKTDKKKTQLTKEDMDDLKREEEEDSLNGMEPKGKPVPSIGERRRSLFKSSRTPAPEPPQPVPQVPSDSENLARPKLPEGLDGNKGKIVKDKSGMKFNKEAAPSPKVKTLAEVLKTHTDLNEKPTKVTKKMHSRSKL